jgi:hypothetical protein
MTTTFSQAAAGTRSTLVAGTTSGLRNLANNTARLGAEITPAAGPELYTTPQMYSKFGGNPTAGAIVWQCWILEAKYDGSAWQYPTIGASSDGSSTVYPAWAPDFVFFWDGGTAHAGAPDIMQAVPRVIPRPAGRFKVLARNVSGQTTANSADTDTILYEVVGNELGT